MTHREMMEEHVDAAKRDAIAATRDMAGAFAAVADGDWQEWARLMEEARVNAGRASFHALCAKAHAVAASQPA